MKVRELKSLRKRYVELRKELITTIANSDFEVDVAGDAVDKLQGASLLRVQNQLSKNNLNKLRALERAIEQIDVKEYGNCEECGEPIGLKRLEALPGVTLCVTCAEKAERQR
jgi:DnaK suppressor protein